jgi:hypothetical protein
MPRKITNIVVRTLKPIADTPLVPGGKLLDLGINMATWEPFFIPLGAPVFAVAGLASVIDPDPQNN